MQDNIYMVYEQNSALLSELIYKFKKSFKNPLVLCKNDLTSSMMQALLNRLFPHLPLSSLKNSAEYLFLYKNLECSQAENILRSICENNTGFNILFYGDFGELFSNEEWLEKNKHSFFMMKWTIKYMALLDGKKTFTNKTYEKIAENQRKMLSSSAAIRQVASSSDIDVEFILLKNLSNEHRNKGTEVFTFNAPFGS